MVSDKYILMRRCWWYLFCTRPTHWDRSL